MKLDRNNIHILVERDRPKKSESVGQTLLQLPWKQKRGDLKKFGFLSSNFMKLCRNIHRRMWQLLGGWKKFEMAAVMARYNMAANYKNHPIWAKFGFQVDYDVTNWYSSLGCYGGQFEFKMAANIQKSSIWAKFGFQVYYDVANL